MNDARRRFAVLCAFLLACLGAAMPVRAMETMKMEEARREEPGGVPPRVETLGYAPLPLRGCFHRRARRYAGVRSKVYSVLDRLTELNPRPVALCPHLGQGLGRR